jgi:hypothetical protein
MVPNKLHQIRFFLREPWIIRFAENLVAQRSISREARRYLWKRAMVLGAFRDQSVAATSQLSRNDATGHNWKEV